MLVRLEEVLRHMLLLLVAPVTYCCVCARRLVHPEGSAYLDMSVASCDTCSLSHQSWPKAMTNLYVCTSKARKAGYLLLVAPVLAEGDEDELLLMARRSRALLVRVPRHKRPVRELKAAHICRSHPPRQYVHTSYADVC